VPLNVDVQRILTYTQKITFNQSLNIQPVFPLESQKKTYTYNLTKNSWRSSLLTAITPTNLDVLDI